MERSSKAHGSCDDASNLYLSQQMLASTTPNHFTIINLPYPQYAISSTLTKVRSVYNPKPRRSRVTVFDQVHRHNNSVIFNPKPYAYRNFFTRVCGDGSGANFPNQNTTADSEETSSGVSSFGDSYVALFVRMLGLDQDPLDREQAIVALWKYSLGGKKFIDNIMQFHGCLTLIISLVKSESSSTCEAASGLLRSISSVNLYRDSVAESGAVEELTSLLCQSSLTSEVKEQSICTLWNLSVDEKIRLKIANSDALPLLIKALDDEDIKVKEAAGGVLSTLALSHTNHKIMVEAGVIPKLAKLFNKDVEGSKVIRKEARNVLLQLAKDEYYRILVIEEGLVLVPLIGASAYKSFRPSLYSWPSLPDGTEVEQTFKGPSRFGAKELLLGLNVDQNVDLEEAKRNAIVGRTQQQFLARIGAIELEDENKSLTDLPTDGHVIVLPWIDGVARLVLILGLQDELAISRAAQAIADASINEHMRVSFKEAGAIKNLVELLDHNNGPIRSSVINALERLSISHSVCYTMEAEGVIYRLVNIIKHSDISDGRMEKTLDILSRILEPSKELKSKFYERPVNGSKKGLDATKLDDPYLLVDRDTTKARTSTSRINSRKEVLDPSFIVRLVEVMKTASSKLQRKAASILEFVTFVDPSMTTVTSVDIVSSLDVVFQQHVLEGFECEMETQQPERYILAVEEAGLAVSSASRLLLRLIDSEKFRETISFAHFTEVLRKILKSNIPLHNKDWVAASLVKLSSLSGRNIDPENSINMEVTLYETIPRLTEQMKSSFSVEAQEAAVVELGRIVSELVVGSTQVIASEGGIFPLVKMIETGSDRAVDASLSVLYSLSMDSENHSAIIAAGAVPALKRIVQSQRPQWTEALRVLRTLPT